MWDIRKEISDQVKPSFVSTSNSLCAWTSNFLMSCSNIQFEKERQSQVIVGQNKLTRRSLFDHLGRQKSFTQRLGEKLVSCTIERGEAHYGRNSHSKKITVFGLHLNAVQEEEARGEKEEGRPQVEQHLATAELSKSISILTSVSASTIQLWRWVTLGGERPRCAESK